MVRKRERNRLVACKPIKSQNSQLECLMRPKLIAITALAFLCCLFFAQFAQAQKRELGIVGRPAPHWKVSAWHQLPNGKQTLDVTDFKGKITYLYFFQSWCPGCHARGFPTLKAINKQYQNDEAIKFATIQTTFEGHRINTADKLAPTAKKFELNIPFGQSAGKNGTPEIMQKYRSGGTPWVVIIDKQGVVRYNDFHISVEDATKLINSLKLEQEK